MEGRFVVFINDGRSEQMNEWRTEKKDSVKNDSGQKCEAETGRSLFFRISLFQWKDAEGDSSF
jgi:hypothetical protein